MDSATKPKLHLTKDQRLPMCYKEVEKVLTSAKKCEANVKTVLHNSRLRGHILSKVTSLSLNVLKNGHVINGIIEETQLLQKEPSLRKELAGILIYELINGRSLPGISKPIQTVRKYESEILSSYNNLTKIGKFTNSLITLPRYVRVNTLVTTLSDVLEDLNYANMEQIFYDETISDEEYLALLKDLKKGTFLIDKHFENLLVFNSKENLAAWSLYQKGHICIQDKSSYIPSYVLAPAPGASVIDACAAPGMKTLHLTALMENKGTIFAFERDQKRFEGLKKVLESHHTEICETNCEDFKSVDPHDEKFARVEYVLLDPSCSGSGMVNRLDSITDTERSKEEARLQKLAGFQIILLKHALLFPSVKRVVYSTCSTTETENEFVLQEVLSHFGHRFKLSCVLPDWPTRGSENYEFGHLCLRAYPEKNLTNGFFVAMLERIESPNGESYSRKEKSKKHKDKKRDNKTFRSKNENQPSFKSNKHSVETNINDCSLKKSHKKHKKMPADKQYNTHLNSSPNCFVEKTQNAGAMQHVSNEISLPELESKHKKKTKHKKKNYESSLLQNSVCNEITQTDRQHDTEQTAEADSNIDESQLSISALENKKRKRKHKHNKKILENERYDTAQATDTVKVEQKYEIAQTDRQHDTEHKTDADSNIDESQPSISALENRKHKKKHKHNKKILEDEDTEQPTDTVKVEQNDDDNEHSLSTLENKKKHKKKHKHKRNDESSILQNNSFDKKINDTELAINAIQFDGHDGNELSPSVSEKKKKHKHKHHDTHEFIPLKNNASNKMSSDDQETETVHVEPHGVDGTECYSYSSEKKKIHKHKYPDNEFIPLKNNMSNKKSSDVDEKERYFSTSEKKKKHLNKHNGNGEEFIPMGNNTHNNKSIDFEETAESVNTEQNDVDENNLTKNCLQNKRKRKHNHNYSFLENNRHEETTHDTKLVTESEQHIYENEPSAVENKKRHKKKHKHKHNDND